MPKVLYSAFALLISALLLSQNCALAKDEKADLSTAKPLVVMIFDQNCHTWCAQVRPMVAALKKDHENDVEFAEIDMTQSVIKEAKEKAAQLRIRGWIEDVGELIPLVMMFPANRKKPTELPGPKSQETYEKELQQVMAKSR